MHPKIFEQRLLSDTSTEKWCPHCRGYPAYILSDEMLESIPKIWYDVVRIEFAAGITGDPDDPYAIKCIHCSGTGKFVWYSVRKKDSDKRGATLTPGQTYVGDQDKLRRRLHAALTRAGARLVRFMVTNPKEWHFIEPYDGTE